jgi:hypothetical protein
MKVRNLTEDRRAAGLMDRRQQPRNGRRKQDPRKRWRLLALWFGVYGAYLSLRMLPSVLRRYLQTSRS